jgi:hypothetical protein
MRRTDLSTITFLRLLPTPSMASPVVNSATTATTATASGVAASSGVAAASKPTRASRKKPKLNAAAASTTSSNKKHKKLPYVPFVPLTAPAVAAALERSTAWQTRLVPLAAQLFPLGPPPPATLLLYLAVFDTDTYPLFLRLMARCSDPTWLPFLVPCADTIPFDQPFLLLHMHNGLDQLVGVSLVQGRPVAGAQPPDVDAPGADNAPIDAFVDNTTTGVASAPSLKAAKYAHAHEWARALFCPRAEAHPSLHPLWAALDHLLFFGLGHQKRHSTIVHFNDDLQDFAFHGLHFFLQHAFLFNFFLSTQ